MMRVGRARGRGGRRRTVLGFTFVLLAQATIALAVLVAVPSPASAWTPHPPIVINGNAEFTPANGVTAGSGSPADPYVIAGWEIDGSANSGIEVYNTDAHFVIRDVYVHSSLIDAIFLYSVRNGRVENATVSGNDGAVYIQVSSYVTVASSNISLNTLDAIVLDWSSNITVDGNEMWGNGDWGVFTYEADDLVIRNNTIANNGWAGIELSLGSDRILVEGNRVANHNVAGLIADTASNVTIVNNTFPDNDFNVDLTNSVDVLIRNNTVATSTADGITITGGARLTVEENNITGNGGGVLAVGTTGLLVRHNAFWGNLPQAADNAGANAWDDGYPSGGNYWSDYAGVDTCSGPNQNICPLPDGIGDTPYVIDADSRDRYPLMQPFTTGRAGYTVTIIPPLSGDAYTISIGINETGAVVGWSTTGGFERPFLYTDAGGTVLLPLAPNTTRGGASDISDTGIAVGFLFGPNQSHAMRWPAGGPPQDLGTMGGPTSRGMGVNATGAVTGSSDYGGPLPKAFLYTDATGFIDIAPAASGQAADVNDAGVVAGYAGARAIRWSDGALEDLGGGFGLDMSRGMAINQLGQVAGCLWDVTPSMERAARFTDGVGWEALGPEADVNCGTGINAYGDVVGAGRPTGTGIVRAFLYTDAGGMQDLERMTDRTPQLRLLAAYDINDRGQIVGVAWDNGISQYVGFRLEPTVPQPPNRGPTVNVLAPNGGEFWGSGASRLVEWRMTDLEDGVLSVTAELSTDGGLTFPTPMFSGPFGQGTKKHSWTLPAVVTTTARVRICVSDSEGLSACDVSDGDFAIDPSAIVISVDTSPTGFPIRVDGVNHTAPYPLSCAPASLHSVEVAATQPINQFSRYGFLNWSDGGALAHNLVCDANRTVTADYQLEWWIELATDPVGLALLYDGIPVATPQRLWCAAGSTHLLGAPSPNGAGPDVRYAFDRWIDTSVENPRTHSCNGAALYTAAYHAEFRLTLDTSPTGLTVVRDGVNLTAPATTWCPDLSIHTIGAPSPQFLGGDRYEFSSWSDGGAQSHPMMCLAPGTITAFFLGPFAAAPSVTVTSPNGGEDWTGGSGHSISWTMSDDRDATLSVTVDLSIDGGATFPFPIFSGSFNLGANTLPWIIPPVDTTQARIQVCALDSDGLAGCDTSDADFAIDSTRPALAAILPPNGAVGVDPNASIVMTFSESMSRASTEAAVTMAPSPGAATYSWDGTGRVLTIDPPPLVPGTVYTVTVSCGALDSSDPGNALASCPVSSTFTTAVPPVPPQVTVAVPAGGEVWTGGAPHAIEWTMTDPDSGDLSADLAFSVDGGATWMPIAGPLLMPQGTRTHVWIVPAIDAAAAIVRVCASDGSLAGCDTSAAFSVDSTPPSVASVSPPDGAPNVPLGALFVVTFSEPMNPATFPIPGVSLVPPVTGVAGTWSPDGRTLALSHNPLAPCTPYTATVDVGGSDLSLPGNPFAIPYTWSFSTVCPPTATLLEPVGGEDWTGASPHQIRFRAGDESDLQVRAWLNLTVDGVTSALFLGLVSVGETSMPWTVPSSSATAAVALTIVDSSGLTATATSGSFAIDATPPALLLTDPADGAGSASVQRPLVLTFSEPMNRVGTETAVTISPAIGTGSFTWDSSGRVLTISFGSPLAQFTDYVVTIGCGARDVSDPGNPLGGCPGGTTQVQFRTEILTPPPVAVVAAVTEARVGDLVTLDGGASAGDIAAWTWTIADGTGAVVATLGGAVVTHAFAEAGTYRVTLRVTDAFGRTDEYSFDVAVRAAGGSVDAWVLAIVSAAVLATVLFAASEPGRVALVTATAGRIYGGKPKTEKDSELRGAILYYVRVHPGDCYMDIKRNLGLNDGVVTYHLARLEKDALIRSAIQGARMRYYPAEMRVPLENGGELHEIQQRILRVIAQAPGMPVAVLSEQLGLSTQLTLYHLRKLAQGGRVQLERSGLRLRAFPPRTHP